MKTLWDTPDANTRELAERLARRVEIDPITGCHIWIGDINRTGYGRMGTRVPWSSARRHLAHRLVWEIQFGPIAAGLEIDHLCRNKPCVNLDHLEPVTGTENRRRQRRALIITHCPSGHLYDEANSIYQGSKRKCRACVNANKRRWYHRHHPTATYRTRAVRS